MVRAVVLLLLFIGVSHVLLLGQVNLMDEEESLSLAQVFEKKAERLFRSQPDSARYYSLASLPLFEKEKNWPAYINGLSTLAALAYYRVDLEEYASYVQQAYECAQEHVTDRHPAYATSLNNLATLMASQGDYDQAIELHQQAIEIQDQDDPSQAIRIAERYHNLGVYQRKKGDLHEALRNYQYAWSQKRKLADVSPYSLARSLHAMGRIFQQEKRWDSASHYFEAGLTEAAKQQKRPRLTYDCYLQLIAIAIEQQDWQGADSKIKETQALLVDFPRLKGDRLMLLQAQLFHKIDDIPKAEKAFTEVIAIRQKRYAQQSWHPELAEAFHQFALFEASKKDQYAAAEGFLQALNALSDSHVQSIQTLTPAQVRLKSQAIEILRDWANGYPTVDSMSLPMVRLAAKLIQQLRTELIHPESKAHLYADMTALFETGIAAAISAFQATNQKSYWLEAFRYMENSKAILFTEQLQGQQALLEEGIPDSLVAVEKQLKSEIFWIQTHLHREEKKGSKARKVVLQELQGLLFEKQNRFNACIFSLEENYPSYFQQKYGVVKPSVSMLQQQLQQGEGLRSFFWGEKQCWVLAWESGKASAWGIERSELEQHLKAFLAILYEAKTGKEAFKSFNQHAQWLSRHVLKLAHASQVVNHIKLSTDGPLHLLPFQLLPHAHVSADSLLNMQSLSSCWRSFPYALHQVQFEYIYAFQLKQVPKPSGKATCLALAPKYDASLDLTYNAPEAIAVATIWDAPLTLASQATKAYFLDQIKQYDMVHFSGHAFATGQQDSLSYLLFSKNPAASDSFDQRLNLQTIYGLSLSNRLIVLSACETGMGYWKKREGIMSLARAFRYAGAQAVVTSLWKADGYTSAQLMAAFHRYVHQGKSQRTALQQAQIDYLQQAGPAFTHPYFWGNMRHIGYDQALVPASGWKWGLLALAFVGLLFIGLKFIRSMR